MDYGQWILYVYNMFVIIDIFLASDSIIASTFMTSSTKLD